MDEEELSGDSDSSSGDETSQATNEDSNEIAESVQEKKESSTRKNTKQGTKKTTKKKVPKSDKTTIPAVISTTRETPSEATMSSDVPTAVGNKCKCVVLQRFILFYKLSLDFLFHSFSSCRR